MGYGSESNLVARQSRTLTGKVDHAQGLLLLHEIRQHVLGLLHERTGHGRFKHFEPQNRLMPTLVAEVSEGSKIVTVAAAGGRPHHGRGSERSALSWVVGSASWALATPTRLVQTLVGAEEAVFKGSKVRTVACGHYHTWW